MVRLSCPMDKLFGRTRWLAHMGQNNCFSGLIFLVLTAFNWGACSWLITAKYSGFLSHVSLHEPQHMKTFTPLNTTNSSKSISSSTMSGQSVCLGASWASAEQASRKPAKRTGSRAIFTESKTARSLRDSAGGLDRYHAAGGNGDGGGIYG